MAPISLNITQVGLNSTPVSLNCIQVSLLKGRRRQWKTEEKTSYFKKSALWCPRSANAIPKCRYQDSAC